MNVANIKHCKELYELSGWKDCTDFYVKSFTKKNEWKQPIWEIERYSDYTKDMTLDDFLESNVAPAYDLGYLLRKLPYGTTVSKSSDREHYGAWLAGLTDIDHALENPSFREAATPEDVLAQLAIELLKSGVLTGENETAKPKASKKELQ